MQFFTAFLIAISFKVSATNDELEEFSKMFQHKRIHQLTAVKQLLSMNPENQLRLLDSMLTKMTSVLTESKTILAASNSNLDVAEGKLPAEQKDKSALALVLENTCLASDILLRFPDYMLKKLHKNKEFDVLYKWGLGYINETVSYLMDDATKRLFYLAGQELQLGTENDPSYVNPYKKPKSEPKKIMFTDTPPKNEKKPKKKIKKGPRMTKSEL